MPSCIRSAAFSRSGVSPPYKPLHVGSPFMGLNLTYHLHALDLSIVCRVWLAAVRSVLPSRSTLLTMARLIDLGVTGPAWYGLAPHCGLTPELIHLEIQHAD
jgi:hypothetical protein